MIRTLLLATCIAIPAYAEDDDHKATLGGVEILHAWTNATDEDHADVYMEIDNASGGEIALVSAKSDAAGEIELLATALDGSGKTEAVAPFPIPQGTEQHLEPDAIFFHLDGLKGPLIEGEDFEMVIVIDPIGEIEVHVEIEDADARAHSHAGHNH